MKSKNTLLSTKMAVCILAYSILMPFLNPNLIAQERCLKNAFNYFNSAEYEKVIQSTNECIDKFARAAKIQQNKLIKKYQPGVPNSENISQVIFQQGLVNDVAASYFLKGRSGEYLYQRTGELKYRQIAEEAYKNAMVLDYGLIWDVKGWFWSPSEAASDRLDGLPALPSNLPFPIFPWPPPKASANYVFPSSFLFSCVLLSFNLSFGLLARSDTYPFIPFLC